MQLIISLLMYSFSIPFNVSYIIIIKELTISPYNVKKYFFIIKLFLG